MIIVLSSLLLLHTLDISFKSSTIGTPKSTNINITNDFICYMNNNNNATTNTSVCITNSSIIDSATPSLSGTYNISESTISSKTHIIITSTSISTNNITTNSDFPRKKSVVIPVLLYSLTGGLLGLCFILCIVGLILKRKYKRRNKTKVPEVSLTPCNPSFHR